MQHVDASRIMQVGMGFWTSKALLTAVNLELFTHLSQGPLTGQDIQQRLDLHERALYDFLDALVALGFLKRTGVRETAVYSNTCESGLFLDKNKLSYMGGILEMSNDRLYPFWQHLEEALKTGRPQNELKTSDKPAFEAIYSDQDKTRAFIKAMGAIQMQNFMALATQFDFSPYQTHCDVGGSGGYLSVQIAMNHSHMNCISYDLECVTPIAEEYIDHMGLTDRVTAQSGDFMEQDLPQADVITMANVLHDWGEQDKTLLIQKAYDALPAGGALVIIENIIDDDRKENAFGLLMSLNMLIETPEGFDFSAADFEGWARQIGFTDISTLPLNAPSSAVIAIK